MTNLMGVYNSILYDSIFNPPRVKTYEDDFLPHPCGSTDS